MLRSLRRFPLFLLYRDHSSASLAAAALPSSPASSPTTPISAAELEALLLQHYRHGKFHDILHSIVSHPSVLLAACRNLASASDGGDPPSSCGFGEFPVHDVSRELREGGFDVASCCVKMVPSRVKGEARIFPDLKLKVVIEAVRMALEVVYDKRYVTFSYGCRVGMGRHTAVRYLKSSVHNPTWWFRVMFQPSRFCSHQVRKLTSLIAEKVDDPPLINLIERLFLTEAIVVELGRLEMGRGFPQESSFNSILLNIYLDGLDHDIQDLRLQVQHQNQPVLAPDEIKKDGGRMFHNPVRLYAVRYLDEILLITSGSKMFTMNIKDRVVEFLERNLDLRVDKLRTTIHNAVSEKMSFIGMELQAVPPSVLHPPMSEKAIRAQKKYLKRKAAKALELKNARETRRKKLGMKILSHVFRKLKRIEGFKFNFQIEDEVREIFGNWADEVVREFFNSNEECHNLHRVLSSGDFLQLKKIREQLPSELVDAYDQLMMEVDRYLLPSTAGVNMNENSEEDEVDNFYDEDEEEEEEEEEEKYAERTVEDLTKLCMRVNAPIEIVRRTVKLAGFTNSMGRPRPIKLLICLEDSDIVKWYAGVGRRWLNFFCCCRNFNLVKTVVSYHLRFSCFLTLAEKHESSKLETIKHYTKDLNVSDVNGTDQVYFPTEREIKMMGDKNLSDPMPVDGALCLILVRLAFDETSSPCVGHFCSRTDIALYRVRLLQNRLNVDPLNEKKWVPGLGAIHECLNKKCLPLCQKHASNLYLGRISLQDVDCTSFVDVGWLKFALSYCTPDEASEFHLYYVEDEIRALESTLPRKNKRVGFCHNDLQYGNIMMDEDYEYASYNDTAYDFTRYFCEMAANYHSETPHIMNYNKYIEFEERKKMWRIIFSLQIFLTTSVFIRAFKDSMGENPSNAKVEEVLQDVQKCTLANHLLCGLWGLILDHIYEIDFDYMEYAKQRIQQNWLRKPALLMNEAF